ncbi:MAG: response regulator [Verrucomicrobiota bacterium]|nr:response regulator [Verrucomicrobiota bacterium]
MNILVADDNDQLRPMMCRMLEAEGHSVTQAVNGVEALEMVQLAPVDLLITDIIMPEKEGIETIVELRRKFPKIRILAISGGGWMEPDAYLETARELGAHATLPKPFNREAFLAAVQQAMVAPV